MDIRMATADDIPALVEMGEGFFGTGKLPGRFDADTFVSFWSSTIASGRGALIMGDQDEEPVGTLGCLLFQDPCCGDLVAQELFWWVNEEARGNGSIMLLHAFEAWAKEQGAARVILSAICGLRDEALGRVYERRGYRELETNYVKEV